LPTFTRKKFRAWKEIAVGQREAILMMKLFNRKLGTKYQTTSLIDVKKTLTPRIKNVKKTAFLWKKNKNL